MTSLTVPVGALYDATSCPRRSPIMTSLPVPVVDLYDLTSRPCGSPVMTSLPVPVGAVQAAYVGAGGRAAGDAASLAPQQRVVAVQRRTGGEPLGTQQHLLLV